ncbi:tripartite motif-containing protein 14-like [Lepisosteus oculatus]|uniref:tripartite motif-containing protein 14-like n=1 Tax=Lepisosteus oculatus TaxID=7918 RepID=UPI00371F20ED
MKTYKELAEEFKGSLEDLLQSVNGKLSENQKLLTEQERNEKMITNNPMVEEGLEQLRERLRALVDSLVSELRQHCEAQSRDAVQALQTNHRALKQERQGLESIRADINALLQISDPLSFIEIFHSKRDKICKDLETPLLKPDPLYLNRKETFGVMDSRSRNFTADALVQIRQLKSRCCGDLPALDVNTAHPFIKISDDLLSATNVGRSQSYPDHPDRFDHYEQVLTLQSISSGTHYWEIEVQGGWRVGVAYNTIKRKGREDGRCLGRGKDSWSIRMNEKRLSAWHDNRETALPVTLTHSRVALSLDYGASTVSLHDVGDTLTHLHTFSTTFTQPVCLGFAVFSGQGVSSISIVKM